MDRRETDDAPGSVKPAWRSVVPVCTLLTITVITIHAQFDIGSLSSKAYCWVSSFLVEVTIILNINPTSLHSRDFIDAEHMRARSKMAGANCQIFVAKMVRAVTLLFPRVVCVCAFRRIGVGTALLIIFSFQIN